MADRSSNWSITLNNPSKEDEVNIANLRTMPWFVSFNSQLEKGEEGTLHIQGHLKTHQVRFSAVKKALPRAHIEVARNATALAKYVAKAETRERERPMLTGDIPSLWDYTQEVASLMTVDAVDSIVNVALDEREHITYGDAALKLADRIVAQHIREGRRGVEFISMNPLFRSTLKTHWRSMIIRNNAHPPVSPYAEEDYA